MFNFNFNKTVLITVFVIVFTLFLTLGWTQEGEDKVDLSGESITISTDEEIEIGGDDDIETTRSITTTESVSDLKTGEDYKSMVDDKSGSFNYTYPINLPAGTNGMNPNLSLVYNSMAENGILGMGFSLNGLSEITRDSSYPINFDVNDHYMLDGQRLIWVPDGTSGVINAGYYHTEKESYMRIACYDANNNKIDPTKSSISYWIVTQKNGTKMYYGYTSSDHNASNDGKINAIDKSLPRVWALNKVEDVIGNYYTVEYFEDNLTGAYYPKNIVYTKGNGLTKYKEVNFYYETREDFYSKYIPTKVNINLRLCWIVVKIDGKLLREYNIRYNISPLTRSSQIISINEYGNNGISPSYGNSSVFVAAWNTIRTILFSSTDYSMITTSTNYVLDTDYLSSKKFKWNSKNIGFTNTGCGIGNQLFGTNYHTITGDFDGDGKTDIISTVKDVGTHNIIYYDDSLIRSNNSNNNSFEIIYCLLPSEILIGKINEFDVQSFVGDFNGDGRDDLLRASSNPTYNKLWISGNDYKFTVCTALIKLDKQMIGNDSSNAGFMLYTADFDGDGKTDLLRVSSAPSQNLLWLSGEKFKEKGILTTSQLIGKMGTEDTGFYANYNNLVLFLADFNGDGRTDIIRCHESNKSYNNYWVSDGSGFKDMGKLDDWMLWGVENNKRNVIYMGDFNGDGKTDILKSQLSYKDTTVHKNTLFISTGDGFINYGNAPYNSVLNGTIYDKIDKVSYPVINLHIGDYNGDGKSDILRTCSNSKYNRLFLSIGNGFCDKGAVLADDVLGDVKNTTGTITSDFNGDGKTDIFTMKNTTGSNLYWNAALDNSDMIVSVINSNNGEKIDIQYKPISQFIDSIGTNISYPYVCNKSPRLLVSSITYSSNYNNVNDEIKTSYEYKDGKTYKSINRNEQCPLGFNNVIIYNPDGSRTIKYYIQDDKDKSGMVRKIENYGNDGKLYKKQEYYYVKKKISILSNYLPIYSINMTDEITYNYNGTTTPVLYGLAFYQDEYGNPKRQINYGEVVRLSNAGRPEEPIPPFTIPETLIRSSKIPWMVMLDDFNLVDINVCDDIEEETIYAYNIDINNYIFVPVEVKKFAVKLDFQTNEYEADLSLSANTKYYYDDNSTKGVIGVKGLLTKVETQVNGSNWISTTNKYDNYGNLIETIDPKGNKSTITYDADYHAYVTGQCNAKGHTTSIGYDELMRPVYTMDVNSQKWSISYDEYGRTIKEWSPLDDETNPTKGIEYIDAIVDENDNITSYMCIKSYQKENTDANYSTKAGYLVSYSYYNGLGQIIQSKIEAVENNHQKWRTIDYYYDEAGRNWKISVPYFTDSTTYSGYNMHISCASVLYDPIGRIYLSFNPKIDTRSVTFNSDGSIFNPAYKSMIYKQKWTVLIDELNHASLIENDGPITRSYLYEGTYTNNLDNWDTMPTDYYSMTETKSACNGQVITSYDDNNNPIHIKIENNMVGEKIKYTDPDKGTCEYTYDANGNLLSQKDSKGQVINFEYDNLNRVTLKKYGDTRKTLYYYDEAGYSYPRYSIGKLTRVRYSDNSYGEAYYYDQKGRLKTFEKGIYGCDVKLLKYNYDAMDRVIEERYPDNEWVRYTYSGDGNLVNVTNGSGYTYVKDIAYEANGKVNKIAYGNNITVNYGYDLNSFRLTSIYTDNTKILNLTYTYDVLGNVKTRTDNNYPYQTDDGFTEKYLYNIFNKLVEAKSASELYGIKGYVYDKLNNITQKDGRTYIYDSTRPHAVKDDGQYTYEYDPNGNMTIRKQNGTVNRSITYDYENRVSSISDGGIYIYDDTGRRMKKVENGITTYYFFKNYEVETDGTITKETKYYFANGQKIAQRTRITTETGNSTLLYTFADHLGSTTILTDENGNLIQKIGYMPYGELAYMVDGEGKNIEKSNTKYMFTGQEKEGNGLYYYGARYYDPMLGRFLQADMVLDGLNRYAYCGNNPVNYVDPSGHIAYRLANNRILSLSNEGIKLLRNMENAAAQCTQYDDVGVYNKARYEAHKAGTDPDYLFQTFCNWNAIDFLTNDNKDTFDTAYTRSNFNGCHNLDYYNCDLSQILNKDSAGKTSSQTMYDNAKDNKLETKMTREEIYYAANQGRKFIVLSPKHVAVVAPCEEPFDPKKGLYLYQEGGGGTNHHFVYESSTYGFGNDPEDYEKLIVIEVFEKPDYIYIMPNYNNLYNNINNPSSEAK